MRKVKNGEEILEFIESYISEKKYPPSIREIAKAVDAKSTSTIHNRLYILEAEGKLKIDRGIPRGIRLINKSEDCDLG